MFEWDDSHAWRRVRILAIREAEEGGGMQDRIACLHNMSIARDSIFHDDAIDCMCKEGCGTLFPVFGFYAS